MQENQPNQVYALYRLSHIKCTTACKDKPAIAFLVQFMHNIGANPDEIAVCQKARVLQK